MIAHRVHRARLVLYRIATGFISLLAIQGSVQAQTASSARNSCFLLWEQGKGTIRKDPAEACNMRASPASTFKIPHALAALDARVLTGAEHVLALNDRKVSNESWRRDHTLESAMHNSVLWYFQDVAGLLGQEREDEYLRRLNYGNMDASSGLKTFWLGRSLEISPEEQLALLIKLYANDLPVTSKSMAIARRILVQPRDVIVDARGQHSFLAPWAEDVIVSAKTGRATDRAGRGIRWLVGHVKKGKRAYVFVSCVVGSPELDADAAIDLARNGLREAGVL